MDRRRRNTFLLSDMKRAFSSWELWIAIIALTTILLHGVVTYTNLAKGASSTYVYIVNAMALSGFGPFAAVFPALGYGAVFCEEYNSGYFLLMRSRMNWKRYAGIRLITVAVSGGTIMAIPFTVVCLFGYIQGKHGVPADGFMEGTQMVLYLERYGDGAVIALKILLGFLFGAMFALISYAFAIFSANRYMAMIAPFVLYEAMWFVLYDYPVVNPIYLFRGDDLDSYPLSIAMECLYTSIVAVVCWLGIKRKVTYEE